MPYPPQVIPFFALSCRFPVVAGTDRLIHPPALPNGYSICARGLYRNVPCTFATLCGMYSQWPVRCFLALRSHTDAYTQPMEPDDAVSEAMIINDADTALYMVTSVRVLPRDPPYLILTSRLR